MPTSALSVCCVPEHLSTCILLEVDLITHMV